MVKHQEDKNESDKNREKHSQTFHTAETFYKLLLLLPHVRTSYHRQSIALRAIYGASTTDENLEFLPSPFSSCRILSYLCQTSFCCCCCCSSCKSEQSQQGYILDSMLWIFAIIENMQGLESFLKITIKPKF